jgi:hypothetical protein
LWNYFAEARRKQLYDVYAAMMHLRNTYSTFTSLSFNYMLSGAIKRMKLNDPAMNAVVLTNFSVTNQDATPSFHHTGTWYEYFTGDSIVVTDVNAVLNMTPGEYRVYTDVQLEQPEITDAPVSLDELVIEEESILLYPNPGKEEVSIRFTSNSTSAAQVVLVDQLGKTIMEKKVPVFFGENTEKLNIIGISPGNYSLFVIQGNRIQTAQLNIAP